MGIFLVVLFSLLLVGVVAFTAYHVSGTRRAWAVVKHQDATTAADAFVVPVRVSRDLDAVWASAGPTGTAWTVTLHGRAPEATELREQPK